MRKIKGVKLGRRLFQISKWVFRPSRVRPGYQRLNPSSNSLSNIKPICKLLTWGHRLTSGARSFCSSKPGSGYMPLGDDRLEEKKEMTVPKGHLAVYVGQKDGDFHRVLVPVFYFNHPLFGELLREAEAEYGFEHKGGITIPCGYSEFERVQTRIQAASNDRKLTWKPNCYGR